jgi:hypothetical protein
MIRDRYPGWNVLSQRGHWDETTRKVIMDRVHNVPSFRYFTTSQIVTLGALCARVIPQAHHPPECRVPIAHWIDQSCALGANNGYRYEDMPPQPLAWTWGLEGLDQTAEALFATSFAELDGGRQDQVMERIRTGDPPGEVWSRIPARRWWIAVALRDISGAYYAHPYAWDEIGFGGPAYPRGYVALNHGAPEPWEPREVPDGRERT